MTELLLFMLSAAQAADAAMALQWQSPVEIAQGKSVRGPWRQNESVYDFVDDPTVAIDGQGHALVAWVDQARKDVFFQRFGRDGRPQLPQPVDVSRNPATFSWLPRLALRPDAPDAVYVLWQEIIFSGGSHGGDMMFARSSDGGRTFSAPLNLSRSVGGDGKGRINAKLWHNGSFDLAAASGGVLYAAWTEYDGPLWLSRSVDSGVTFSAPARIDTGSARPARAPTLAVSSRDALHLAWTVGEEQSADIHYTNSVDGGRNFSTPRRLAPSPGYSDAPKLAVDRAGAIHLVHAESDAGPFGRHHVRHLMSTDGGHSFSAARVVVASVAGAQTAAYPSLAVDDAGRVHVLAELGRDGGGRPRGLALATSLDGGRSFAAAREVPGSADPGGGDNGSTQGLLMKKLALGPDGELAVVNSALRVGSQSRVWLMRGRPVAGAR
ncbi:MAG TPA: sialidase family protein [Ramlibacter sp.]|nr:sialidase family protein [Ramlibacter sp.]